MSRSRNEFVQIFCNTCGSKFHPKYGKETTSRFCSIDCSRQPYLDKRYILQSRIRNSISVVGDCWIWNGRKNELGYGFLRVGTTNIRAHRASYEAFQGEIPEGKIVCHSCDNPSCVNPAHLWVGTMKDNSQDMVKKGRNKPNIMRGTDHKLAKLTEDQARQIKADKRSARAIAEEYGVSHSLVLGIRRGDNWAWLD